MLAKELEAVSRLKDQGDHDGALKASLELAKKYPDASRAQLAAAYAYDRLGQEEEALSYYRSASLLGIPTDERPQFLLSFGSTLRNMGQITEALECFKQAIEEHPDRPEYVAFLALTYHSANQHDQALGTMLEVALMVARDKAFGPYDRALSEYKEELLSSSDKIGD